MLKGKVAVVTGSTSGIGLGIATALAAQGADIVLNGFGDAAEIEKVRAGLAAQHGVKVLYDGADLSKGDAVRGLVDNAVRQMGRIDILVNNAGITADKLALKLTDEDWYKVIAVNLSGAFFLSQAALRHMAERGTGRIVNVSSVFGLISVPSQSAYNAAKFGVRGFTDALRMELMHDREPISVTLIKPAAIDTPYVQHAQNYMAKEPRNPPPYYAPDIVAEAVLYAAEHPVRDVFVGAGDGPSAIRWAVPAVSVGETVRQSSSSTPAAMNWASSRGPPSVSSRRSPRSARASTAMRTSSASICPRPPARIFWGR